MPQPQSAMTQRTTSTLERMAAKNYSAEWDSAFVAPMAATVPPELGGWRLDQALARRVPQYSRY